MDAQYTQYSDSTKDFSFTCNPQRVSRTSISFDSSPIYSFFMYAMNGQIKGRDWLSLCVLFPSMPVNNETCLLYASFVNGKDSIFVNFFQLHYSHSFSFFHELNRRRKHDIFYSCVETLSLIEKAKVSDKCWESSCPFVRIFPQL